MGGALVFQLLLHEVVERLRPQIAQASKSEVHVTRCGDITGMWDRTRIEQLGFSERIRMLGFREDLLNVFRSFDVFAIPSVEGDTIPQVLMQALAIGLPVVSTTVGSIPDVVIDGETGFVVPPRDALALADRIARLLDDDELRSRMGVQGRSMVERCYSLERMLDRMEGVYDRLIHASG